MDDLIERLLNAEPGARQEAAAEIRRLTASLAAMERERDDLAQKLTTVLRVEGELRKTVAFARKALVTAKDAMSREAWQDGPSISKAEHDLGEMIDVIKHEITIESAEHQLKWAAKKASDAIRERNALRSSCEALTAFVAVMVGRGPDAVIPETIDTPIGVPIKIGEIMRAARAALTPPEHAKPTPKEPPR